MNSRKKGKTGELELAALLRDHGVEARRGQQFRGGADSPDVVGLPGVHVECKRVERLNIYDAYEQAVRDAGNDIPAVFHRKNRKQWLVTVGFQDFMKLYKRSGLNDE